MTSAIARTIYGRTDYTRESQFLKELDPLLWDEEADKLGVKSYQEAGGNGGAGDGTGVGSGGSPERVRYGQSNKPFDRLKYIRQDVEKLKNMESASKASLAAGDRVNHPKFGEGLIISIEKNVVTVAFDSVGMKKLAADVAPLTKN